MIPIRDDTPRYSTPFINYFLIGLNVLIFLYEVFVLNTRARDIFFHQFGVVPASITGAVPYYVQASHGFSLLPIVTSMFLHASWLHLIANMWVLWIFGDNIEDHLGHFLYLIFYLLSGIAASLLHIFFNLGSTVPSVGASGAIAGVMGAYFMLFPSARVLTLVPIIFFFSFIWLPAWIVLGYWFVVQFLSGAATSIAYSQQTGGGIAFWAHVGGFVAGIVMIKILPQRIRRARYQYYRS
jgi:membrane associated rhomboid family serine protease